MKKFTLTVFAMTLLVGMVLHSSAFAVTHTVQVGNYYFNPSSLNVEVGDIVKWVWVQGTHTTTSSTIPGGAASWDAPITSGNQTYSYSVTVAGTYNYVCTLHVGMGMTGSFTASAPPPTLVLSPPSQMVSESSGTTDFSVTSNSNWTAVSDAVWCMVTSSGSGNGMIMATYAANSSTTERTANITVTVSGLTPVIVQVIQDGTSVGIPDNNAGSLQVFPNPARDVVNVSLENNSLNTRISLVDMTGRTIIERSYPGNDITLNVDNLPRGYYFIRILQNNEIIVRRIILAE